MALTDSYKRLKGQFTSQVQGTCGIYSFYNAVCLLRDMNPRNPAVPPPKRSQHAPTDSTAGPHASLRKYAKRELKSGQGELLSETEVAELVAAHGYAPLAIARHGAAVDVGAKKTFLKTCLDAGHPVLIAYMADQFGSEIKYTSAVGPDSGAHWSLIIGLSGDRVEVIEPNAPNDLKVWPLKDLADANSRADRKTFTRFWSKLVTGPGEYNRQRLPKDQRGPQQSAQRGINPRPDLQSANQFQPSWHPQANQGQTKVYDLGGDDGLRHEDQDLKDVLVAVIPPAS